MTLTRGRYKGREIRDLPNEYLVYLAWTSNPHLECYRNEAAREFQMRFQREYDRGYDHGHVSGFADGYARGLEEAVLFEDD